MRWCICDYQASIGEKPCLSSERGVSKLKADPPRCIKHGNILDYAPSLNGMSREQVRQKWKKEDERHG